MIDNVYFSIERPAGWTREQYATALQALEADLQRQREVSYVMPNDIIHWLPRDDGVDAIGHGLVETDRLQPAIVANTMADAIGLPTDQKLALRTEMQTKRRRHDDAAATRAYMDTNRGAWDGV